MVFSSIEFIFIFLPIFFLVYYLLPFRGKNFWLFIASLAFYSYGVLDEPLYILLLIISIVLNYFFGLAISRSEQRKSLWLAAGLAYNFAWLFLFKYSDFIFANINAFFGRFFPDLGFELPLANWILPIGISFYTFQICSYIIDVYKQKVPAEKSVLDLGVYICMFPQLIAGPIVTYSSVAKQLHKRKHTLALAESGLKEFIIGLGLKVLLANQIANLWNNAANIGYESISTPLAWMSIFAYTFQIYFDFYGYSLMAIGLGRMMGFKLPKNFDYPYISTSMTEFWRRWHITLGSWFREYVYIPLGGNRKGTARTIFNLFVVWLLTGIWHGASWNFVLWGLVLFFFIFIEKLCLKKYLDRYRWLGHLYMLLLIPLSWAVFAITDIKQLGIFLGRLFPFLGSEPINVFEQDYIVNLQSFGVLLLVCFIFSTPIPRRIFTVIRRNPLIEALILIAIFAGSLYCLFIGLDDPFLYFRF